MRLESLFLLTQKGFKKKKLDPIFDSSHLLSSLHHTDHARSGSPQDLVTTNPNPDGAAAAAKFTPSMLDPRLLGDNLDISANLHSRNLPDINRSDSPRIAERAHNKEAHSFVDSPYHHNLGEQDLTRSITGCFKGNTCLNSQSFECIRGNSEASRTVTLARLATSTENTAEFSVDYGNGQKSQRPKVRGRFSVLRRKEVQVVRKKGACIRCRMLKKPCSEDTPCNTCMSVESARLWKTPCIRTRVADEFEMYSSGLHAVLAHHDIKNLKSQVQFQPSMDQVHASHFPETAIFASFNSLEGQGISADNNIDPCLNHTANGNILRILDNDSDNIANKLEDYMRRISGIFYEREPSKFMHTTLKFAQELASAKQDYLLMRALDLWSLVHILIDHEIIWNLKGRSDTSINPEKSPTNHQKSKSSIYSLICSQIKAAAEYKASGMCKVVLNDLERRLLQRSAAESFETFLVALITLNCIEKSTWLFKSWEHDSLRHRWPLEKSPESIYSQGEKLADMLQMLLRIRNIPPKTYTRPEDGILATDVTPVAQEFYKKLNLSCKYNHTFFMGDQKLRFLDVHVLSKQADHTFDSANSRCFELRYCSRLLLPVT